MSNPPTDQPPILIANLDKGTHSIVGLFCRTGVPNSNGRLYTEEVMEKAILAQAKNIAAGKIIGTIGWERPTLENASHVLRRVDMNPSGEVIGTFDVLDTPMGKKLTQMLETSAVSFVPCGEGLATKEGVVLDYALTWVNAMQKGQSAFDVENS